MDDLSFRMLIESFLRDVEECEHAAGDGIELIGATWPLGLNRLHEVLHWTVRIEHEYMLFGWVLH